MRKPNKAKFTLESSLSAGIAKAALTSLKNVKIPSPKKSKIGNDHFGGWGTIFTIYTKFTGLDVHVPFIRLWGQNTYFGTPNC